MKDNQRGGNTQQTFWVLVGSLMGFGFSLLSSVILSRYFDKDEYGTFKQVLYVYNSLLLVFTLGLPKTYSFFLPRVNPNEAKDLISKINKVLIILGALLSVSLFLGSSHIAFLLENENLAETLRYFSLVPLLMLPTMGLEGILATYRKTKFLALYNTLTKLMLLLCVVIPVVFFKGGVNSAIIGFTIASFFCFIFAFYLKSYPVKSFGRDRTRYKIKDIFKFALPLMGASLWGVLISSSDQFFISRYYGTSVFADFANGSLELPFVSMIIAATSTVLFPVFSSYMNNKDENVNKHVLQLWDSVVQKTIKLTYPLIFFFIFFAESIMSILYGNEYLSSGLFFQIKLIANFFTVIAYGPLMLSIGGEKYYFKIHMYGAIILILLEFISVNIGVSAYVITAISVICQIGRIYAMLMYLSSFFKIKISKLLPLKLMGELIIINIAILVSIRFINEIYFKNFDIIVQLGICSFLHMILFLAMAKFRGFEYESIFKPLFQKIIR